MKSNFFSRRPDPSAGESSPSASPLRPSPPLAKRLNRNALTVAAVIMGMTVLTAVVVLNPGEEQENTGEERPNVDEEPPVPSRPTFLDEPVWVIPVLPDTAVAPEFAPPEEEKDAPPSQASSAAAGSLANRAYDHAAIAIGSHDAYPSSASAPTSPSRSAREQAFQAALTSSVLLGAAVESRGLSQSDIASLSTEEEQLLSLGDSILRAAARQVPVVGSPVPNESPLEDSRGASRSDRENRAPTFLERTSHGAGTTVIAQLKPAGSPYTLRAGTVIPGTLITGINSDLPGEIVGQVSRDVYDSRTQRILLVPRGSRLIGTYDNQVVAGQGRLLVAWTRLILPDGRSVRLPGLALKDPQGQTGAKDKVDNHWRRVFGNALLLSAIGAGVQLSQPQQASALAPPTAGQVAAGALGQELSSVALEIIRRGMDVAPTITIRPGQAFNVFLNGDLVFDGPYEEEPHVVR
jgi:type IV secretory pathway VirB10-like protein